jgi:hypothetical protein
LRAFVNITKKRLCLTSILGASHRWQRFNERPAIRGVGESRVEHCNNPTILSSSNQPPGTLSEQRRRSRQINEPKRIRAGVLSPSNEQWLVGPTEGNSIDYHE